MLEKKGLSDTRIAQITGISLRTITQWKTQRDTYRYKLYRLLKTMDESELIKAFSQFVFLSYPCFFCLATCFLHGLFVFFFAYPVFLPCPKFLLSFFLLHTPHKCDSIPTPHTSFLRDCRRTIARAQTALIHLTHIMHFSPPCAHTSPRILPPHKSAPHFSAKRFCAFFISF